MWVAATSYQWRFVSGYIKIQVFPLDFLRLYFVSDVPIGITIAEKIGFRSVRIFKLRRNLKSAIIILRFFLITVFVFLPFQVPKQGDLGNFLSVFTLWSVSTCTLAFLIPLLITANGVPINSLSSLGMQTHQMRAQCKLIFALPCVSRRIGLLGGKVGGDTLFAAGLNCEAV